MKYRTLKSIWYEDKDQYKTEKDGHKNTYRIDLNLL